MDGSASGAGEAVQAGALSVPAGKGITHTLVQREHGPNWLTCEWYVAELKGYQRRLEVSEGLDLQAWILERFGSGKYKLALYRGSRSVGYSSPWEIVDPDRPQQPHKIGAPVVVLPAAPPVGAPAGWGPPSPMTGAPTWLQLQELQERAAERERASSLERLQAIRADEDERRERREREEEARRKRDLEEAERRVAADRARAAAELDGLRERHKLDLERMRMDHEFRMAAAAAESARANPAEDWADALEAVEERLAERFAAPPKPSEVGQFLQAIQPHVPAVIQVLQNLGKAVASRAAAPPAAPPPGWTPPAG